MLFFCQKGTFKLQNAFHYNPQTISPYKLYDLHLIEVLEISCIQKQIDPIFWDKSQKEQIKVNRALKFNLQFMD
ncbi:hypothetical protein pb186bvf_007896 [Paramecium bursaria]